MLYLEYRVHFIHRCFRISCWVEVTRKYLTHFCSQLQVISVAARFAVSVDDILMWNPDLNASSSRAAGLPLIVDQPICVLPNVCGV